MLSLGHTRTFRSVMLSLVLYTVMSRVVSFTDLHAFADLLRMMRTFSVRLINLMLSSKMLLTLYFMYSVRLVLKTLPHRYRFVTRITGKNISVLTRTGRRLKMPLSTQLATKALILW